MFGYKVLLTDEFLFVSAPGYDNGIYRDVGLIIAYPRTDTGFDIDSAIIIDSNNDIYGHYFGTEFVFENNHLYVTVNNLIDYSSNGGIIVIDYNNGTKAFTEIMTLKETGLNEYDYAQSIIANDQYLVAITNQVDKDNDYAYVYSNNGEVPELLHRLYYEGFEIQTYIKNIELYGNYLIMVMDTPHYNNISNLCIRIYDLTKSADDEDFYLSITPDNVEGYDSFASTMEVCEDLLLVTLRKSKVEDLNNTTIYAYSLPELLLGNIEVVYQYNSSDIDRYNLGYNIASNGDLLVIGTPYTAGTTMRMGQVEIVSIINDSYTYQEDITIEEYTQTSCEVYLDGELQLDFLSGNRPKDGIYEIIFYVDGQIESRLNVTLDVDPFLLSEEIYYSETGVFNIEANKIINNYVSRAQPIGSGEYFFVENVNQSQITIEVEVEGEYVIKFYDMAYRSYTVTLIYDQTEPTIDISKVDGYIYDSLEIDETSDLDNLFFVYDNNMLVRTYDSNQNSVIYLYDINEGLNQLIRTYNSPSTFTNFGEHFGINDQYVLISARNEFDEAVLLCYDITSDSTDPIYIFEMTGYNRIIDFEINDSHIVVWVENNGEEIIFVQNLDLPFANDSFSPMDSTLNLDILDISLDEDYLVVCLIDELYLYNLVTEEVTRLLESNGLDSYRQVELNQQYLALVLGDDDTTIHVYELYLDSMFLESNLLESLNYNQSNDVSISFSYHNLMISFEGDDLHYFYDLESDFQETIIISQDNTKQVYLDKDLFVVSTLGETKIHFGYYRDGYLVQADDDFLDTFEILIDDEYVLINDNEFFIDINDDYTFRATDYLNNSIVFESSITDLGIHLFIDTSELDYNQVLIESTYQFNKISFDGKQTWTYIEPTYTYLVTDLIEGEHLIDIGYDEVYETLVSTKVVVDHQNPIAEFIYSFGETWFRQEVFHIQSRDYSFLTYDEILVSDDYYIFYIEEYNSPYSDQIYLLPKTAGDDLDQIIVLRPDSPSIESMYGNCLYLNGNLLFVSSGNRENTETGTFGAVYVYDLSLGEGDMLIDIITNPGDEENISFDSMIFEDNMLFLGSQYNRNYGTAAGIVQQYNYDSISGEFTYIRDVIPSTLDAYDGYGCLMVYDDYKLVVSSSNRYDTSVGNDVIYIFDLTKNVGDEGYETIIDVDTWYSKGLGYDLILDGHILYAYERKHYISSGVYSQQLYIFDLNLENPEENYFVIELDPSLGMIEGENNVIEMIKSGYIYNGVDDFVYDATDFYDGIDPTDELKPLLQLNCNELNGEIVYMRNITVSDGMIYTILSYEYDYRQYVVLKSFALEYYELVIDEDNLFRVYEVLDDDKELINNDLLFVEDGNYEFYIIDTLGNETLYNITTCLQPPVILGGNQTVYSDYLIETDKPFNLISVDNGASYQEITETTMYLLNNLSNGEYLIRVKDSFGNESASVKVIFDNQPPVLSVITSDFGSFIDSYEPWKGVNINITTYAIYGDYIYFSNNVVWPSTIYMIDTSKSYYEYGYFTKIERMATNVSSLNVYDHYLVVSFSSDISEQVILYDLDKQSGEEGYKISITPTIPFNTFDFGVKSILIGTKLYVFSEHEEIDDVVFPNRLFVYDLMLEETDPLYEVELDISEFLDVPASWVSLIDNQGEFIISVIDRDLDTTIFTYDSSNVLTPITYELIDGYTFSYSGVTFGNGYAILRVVNDSFGFDYILYKYNQGLNHLYEPIILDNLTEVTNSIERVYFYDENIYLYGNGSLSMINASDVYQDNISICEIMLDHNFVDLKFSTDGKSIFVLSSDIGYGQIYEYYIESVKQFEYDDESKITSIEVYLNDQLIILNKDYEITEVGTYRFVVTDAAGNQEILFCVNN